MWDLRFKNPLDDAESLIHDENYNLQEIGYKTKYYNNIQGQYIGLIKIQGSKLSKILDFYKSLDKSILYDGNSFKNMYMTTFIQLLINKNWSVKSVPIFSGWLEFDSINDLNLYNKLYRKNKLKTFININLK